MKKFLFTIHEMIANEVIYEIEAETYEEAFRKAQCGDTVEEHFMKEIGVGQRFIIEGKEVG